MAWIFFGFEKCWHNQSHRKVSLSFQAPWGCFLQKNASNGPWQNLLANTHETLWIIKNFICLFHDNIFMIFMLCIDLSLHKFFFVSLTFRIVLVILQLFLHNLENRLKFDILATKTKNHQLTKMVLQVVSMHVSRLLCCWHSWHISKSLSIIRQNVAVAVELAAIV